MIFWTRLPNRAIFVNFDNPQQFIPTNLACITPRIVINMLKLTRKHLSLLIPKNLTQSLSWLQTKNFEKRYDL